jgi:hypothetical protein
MAAGITVDTDGLKAGSAALVDIAGNLIYEPPAMPAEPYASNVGAGHVSAAIGVFTAAYASRLVEHADGLARAAGRYAESDSDGGQKIAGSGL